MFAMVFTIYDNTLTADNRDKLISIANEYNQTIKFYNVEKTHADKIEEFYKLIPDIRTNKLSIGSLFRLLMTDIISQDIEKVIYLDSDIIVNLDISELWKIELDDKPLAAVPEILNRNNLKEIFWWDALSICKEGYVEYEDYFNAGVLLMNLKVLRNEKETLRKGIEFRASLKNHSSMDQCILNYCFSSRAKKLPVKFNRFVDEARQKNIQVGDEIYHYVGSPNGSGLLLNTHDNFNKLWLKYFMKTPFSDENSIGRLYGGVQQLHVEDKNFALYVSAMMSGKTRAFFISPQMIDGVKNIFGVQKSEEIIFADSNESIKKLIKSLKKSKHKKVFFISPNIYGQCREILLQAGFTENRDFINIINFLSDAHGVPFNSYQLVKLL